MKKNLIVILVISLFFSRVSFRSVYAEDMLEWSEIESSEMYNENSNASTQSNGVKYFVRLIAEGVLTSFILTATGLDDLSRQVGEWVRTNLSGVVDYTYTYTKDNGCWSPEFPANPFCP